MIIPYISEDNLLTLKTNLNNWKSYFAKDDNAWLSELFDGENPLKETKYTIDDFSLDMSQTNPFLTEFENVKRVYTRLKFLSDSQASDERLWAAMCLGPFYNYTQYRWNIKSNLTTRNIEQHFFFHRSIRAAATRNAISRLWWIGRLTYSETEQYKITEFVCEQSDFIFTILERNTCNNFEILRAFCNAAMDARKTGKKIQTDEVRELAKYLNLLGGLYILDFMEYDWIYNKIYSKALEL